MDKTGDCLDRGQHSQAQFNQMVLRLGLEAEVSSSIGIPTNVLCRAVSSCSARRTSSRPSTVFVHEKLGVFGDDLEELVSAFDDAIVSKNLDGIIHSWNKGAECLFATIVCASTPVPHRLRVPRPLCNVLHRRYRGFQFHRRDLSTQCSLRDANQMLVMCEEDYLRALR